MVARRLSKWYPLDFPLEEGAKSHKRVWGINLKPHLPLEDVKGGHDSVFGQAVTEVQQRWSWQQFRSHSLLCRQAVEGKSGEIPRYIEYHCFFCPGVRLCLRSITYFSSCFERLSGSPSVRCMSPCRVDLQSSTISDPGMKGPGDACQRL